MAGREKELEPALHIQFQTGKKNFIIRLLEIILSEHVMIKCKIFKSGPSKTR